MTTKSASQTSPIHETCQPWCAGWNFDHHRLCIGEERTLTLSHEMTTDNMRLVGLPEEPLPISVVAVLPDPEGEPLVELSRDDQPGPHLTVTEARTYAAHIIAVCDEIEGLTGA